VTAPIEMPVTSTGVNPGRLSYSALSTPYSLAPNAPDLQHDRGVHPCHSCCHW